jgi:hypothetical protein
VIQALKLEPRMMRYELTDYEWAAIKPMLPNKPRGVPRINDRRVLNGIFWVLRSGAPWRDLPENYGPCTLRSLASALGCILTKAQRRHHRASIGFLCGRSYASPTLFRALRYVGAGDYEEDPSPTFFFGNAVGRGRRRSRR